MVYEDFKDLSRKAACDKVLCDKAVNTKNPKYDGYQRGLPSMIDNFLINSLLVVLLKVKLYQSNS